MFRNGGYGFKKLQMISWNHAKYFTLGLPLSLFPFWIVYSLIKIIFLLTFRGGFLMVP